MNRAEFSALPPSIALSLLWDALRLDETELASALAPRTPRPPKYDQAIYRRDGVSWASEYDVEGLRYWRDKKSQSSDPKYAEKDKKAAAALGFWITWRMCEPSAPWTGERNRDVVTARAPSGKPEVYPRQGGRREPEPQRSAAPDFDGGGEDDFCDAPF